jgi:hypothetical protein
MVSQLQKFTEPGRELQTAGMKGLSKQKADKIAFIEASAARL